MRLPLHRTLAVAAIAFAAAGSVSAADIPGHVYTAYSDGVELNGNIFADREDVYVYGTGLSPGEYYIHVRSTEDLSYLGTSVGASDETPVVVGSDGKFAQAYQLWSLVLKSSDGTQGYDKPEGDWCEYWVCISKFSDFRDTAYDSFVVKETEDEPGAATVKVTKFYDANANGTRDSGEASIEGWKVEVSGEGVSDVVFTSWTATFEAGTYTFTEATPVQDNWLHTTDDEVSVTLEDGDEVAVEFGNLCLGDGGGRNPCEWLAKSCQDSITSGDLTALCSLPLVDPWGCSFNPYSKTHLKLYLLVACLLDNECYTDSKYSNMAFLLSAHLAAMKLSVRRGLVDGDALVYAPGCGNTGVGNDFITVDDLMDAAIAALKDDGYTPPNDDDRAWQECLKDALDGANNDLNFVCATPGKFSF